MLMRNARIWDRMWCRLWQFCELPKLLNSLYETATFQKPNLVPELVPELCQNLVPEFGARICGFKFQNLKFQIPEFEVSNSRI